MFITSRFNPKGLQLQLVLLVLLEFLVEAQLLLLNYNKMKKYGIKKN